MDVASVRGVIKLIGVKMDLGTILGIICIFIAGFVSGVTFEYYKGIKDE